MNTPLEEVVQFKSDDKRIVDDKALDVLFRDARTYNGWKDKEVSNVMLEALFDLLKMAPTSANCSPARFKFVKSDEAKARLKPHLMEGNQDKTMPRRFARLLPMILNFTSICRSYSRIRTPKAGSSASRISSKARRCGTARCKARI